MILPGSFFFPSSPLWCCTVAPSWQAHISSQAEASVSFPGWAGPVYEASSPLLGGDEALAGSKLVSIGQYLGTSTGQIFWVQNEGEPAEFPFTWK